MECAKQFQITVVDVPPVLFVWDPASIVPDNGTAAFTPDNASGNTVNASASAPGGPPSTANASNIGFFTWNSNAPQNANLHLEVSNTGTTNPGWFWAADIFVQAPFSQLIAENEGTQGYSAIMDIPFVLPDTGGANWVIEWRASVATFGVTAGSLTILEILTLV